MELTLAAETQAKLNELARRTHRGTDELLEEAVEHLVAYNSWFERKVSDSLAAADASCFWKKRERGGRLRTPAAGGYHEPARHVHQFLCIRPPCTSGVSVTYKLGRSTRPHEGPSAFDADKPDNLVVFDLPTFDLVFPGHVVDFQSCAQRDF
jgi:predicted transcriptional regulator